jgi:diguanylate cyclase (GGDEF)-like protein
MIAARKNHFRLSLSAIALAYLVVHGIVATSLPDWLNPLSTFCIVLAELAAIAASIRASRRDTSLRRWWLLLACSMVLHATAMSLDMVTEIRHTVTFNYDPGFQIFFSMLSGVPLLVAVSLQRDRRIWGMARAIYALLSLAVGAVLYLQIFTILTPNGSTNPADAVLISRIFDAIDVFLATGATLRWLGSRESSEYGFFRILSIFLWVDAILPAIHNRIMLQHDYIWLNLFISAPYVLLLVLILTAVDHPVMPRRPSLVRAIRSGSPLFMTLALVFAGVIGLRSHFYIGLTAVLLAVAGYGALNIFTQSRGLETEDSLLLSNKRLEMLIGVDSLTGIANRHAFDKAFGHEMDASRRTKLPLSLLMIDVDQFKPINDLRGHPAGDEILLRIAGALRAALPRATDLVARHGGDEFSVILAATDSAGAIKTANHLIDCIAHLELRHPSTPSGTVTISIGISTYDGSLECSRASLIRAADRALYLAKRRGRNRSEFLPTEDAPR